MRINNKTTYIAPDQLKMALLDFTNMVDTSALAETSMCPACWEQTFKSVL